MIKVRNENGEIVRVKALKGKSAYKYAVEAGYQGTEEEWGQIVTGKDFINLNSVTVLFNYVPED